jgi:hypothetical protein
MKWVMLLVVIIPGVALAQTGPDGDPLPPPDPGYHWVQTFGDEFNGTSIDTTKWNGTFGGKPPWCNGCPQLYSNMVEGNGVLRNFGGANGSTDATRGINTYGHFSQRFGYFSVRVQNPPAPLNEYSGLWAFAVAHGPPPAQPCNEGFEEYDLDDGGNLVPGTTNFIASDTLHDYCYNGPLVSGQPNDVQYPNNGTDLTAGFHIHGWQWRNDGSAHGTFQSFMDGRVVSPVMPTDPRSNQWDSGIYLLSTVNNLTPIGAPMVIDWIHAYQLVPK